MNKITGAHPDGYAGLPQAMPSLPAAWYFDAGHYQRELERIWYRNWVYLCRSEDVARERDYRVFTIGEQSFIVVRGREGVLYGHFNTCRHRGSVLCRERQGRLKSALITCPYHQWSFALDGRLVRIPYIEDDGGLVRDEFGLYPVAVHEWCGFVFANLAGAEASPFPAPRRNDLAQWPLADLKRGHRYSAGLKCNWKIFWENYSECLHCPAVHPELCDRVPIYSRALIDPRDDPDYANRPDKDDPAIKGGLKRGAKSWTMNGEYCGPVFRGLDPADLEAGVRYATFFPTMFIAAHPDYVRSVVITPTGPASMRLEADWLFSKETLAQPDFDLDNVTRFATLVMDQDAEVSEINQAGLSALPHKHGMLLPQEYFIHAFHTWLRGELDTDQFGGQSMMLD
jgi:Rieske 2Fe-2S family protein